MTLYNIVGKEESTDNLHFISFQQRLLKSCNLPSAEEGNTEVDFFPIFYNVFKSLNAQGHW